MQYYNGVLTSLRRLQVAIDNLMRAVLHLPNFAPTAVLHLPLELGGFGVPVLQTRLSLRFVCGVFRALNSRNVLVRLSIRHLLGESSGPSIPDAACLLESLSGYDMCVRFVPCAGVSPAHDVCINGGTTCTGNHPYFFCWQTFPLITDLLKT